jgi:hypothetical protein
LQELVVAAVVWLVGVLLALQGRLRGCWLLWGLAQGCLRLALLLRVLVAVAAGQQKQQRSSRRQMRQKLLQL